MNGSVERLEPRQLLASVVDLTWRFNQTRIDAAARVHLDLQQVTDAGRGRTVMVGTAPTATVGIGKSVIVAVDSSGRLDGTFSGDGLADPGLSGVMKVVPSPEGYVYAVSREGVVRFRADGGRDRSFAGGKALDFTGGKETFRLLDAKPNVNGGFDVLRTVTRDLGRTFTNVYHTEEELYDSVVQLIHLEPSGSTTLVWEKGARESTIADNVYLDFDIGSVTSLTGGGWVVLSARQQNIDNVDSISGVDTVGDTFVEFISADGAVRNEKVFNTGDQTALSDVRVQGNGARVRFTYGGSREVELTDGTKIRRYNLPVGPTTPGLNDQLLTINGLRLPYHTPYPFTPETGFTVSLLNVDGSVDTRFGNGGTFKLPGTVGNYPGPFTVVSAQPGSVLIAWRNHNSTDTLAITRLWLGDRPSATLTSAAVRDRTATITVQYRSPTGIAPRTVGSPDLLLYSKRKPYKLRLIDTVVTESTMIGSIVTARYRATDLPRGVFAIDLQGSQIGTMSNTVNDAERLGELVIG